ncbi:MAG: hypothetical protein NZM31_13175 [Gemmatales bacterium]|nr:hypothetical protein [Gemmatales bacterium]MDW8387949.1 hypothetical protein [Gemmatales bacterium]
MNPPEAKYCYFDGTDIRLGPTAALNNELGREFIFPSGRRCKTYDDLLRGCCAEWETSQRLLRTGVFKRFFGSLGRMDLATLADKLSKESDADAALDEFLSNLPTRDDLRPRLELNFRRFNLGKIARGEILRVTLAVANAGSRLLRGTVSLEDEPWISFGPNQPRSLTIQTPKEQRFELVIDAGTLIGGQKYLARVRVDTNGGAFEVPIQFEVAVVPFAHPPLDGAMSARDLAYKMKDHPREAVPLLESGEVERWFTANGWRYPVQGPTAKGIGAVQQFFESLGLSKPPPLTLSETEVTIPCQRGITAVSQIELRTNAKKWVFARAVSETPWLEPVEADWAGSQGVTISFAVHPDNLPLNTEHVGRLVLYANGGQKFEVVVKTIVTVPPRRLGHDLVRGLAVGLLIAGSLRLLGALPDLAVRPLSQFGAWLTFAEPQQLQAYYRMMTLSLGWLGILVGGYLMVKRSGWRDLPAGVVAGAVGGLIFSASVACMVVAGDTLLRYLVPFPIPGSAIVGWMLAGMVVGAVLAVLGESGNKLLDRLARPFAWFAERFGGQEFAFFLRGH